MNKKIMVIVVVVLLVLPMALGGFWQDFFGGIFDRGNLVDYGVCSGVWNCYLSGGMNLAGK